MIKVAILGASGHVATNIYYQIRDNNEIYQFSREPIEDPQGGYFYYPYSNFFGYNYDVIINCVGFGNPEDIKNAGIQLFLVTEKYDNMALEYLKEHHKTKYIYISSGVVHNEVDLNNLNLYQISKINAEAKHRFLANYNIVDIRLYSFFTRYVNINAKFFMSMLIKSIRDKTEFVTNSKFMVRDYINPKDLYALINICIHKDFINDALDIYSLQAIEKSVIINYFRDNYGLKVKIKNDYESFSSAGTDLYVSIDSIRDNKTARLGYVPKYSSMDTIVEESKYLL